jgi:hypothetical protein
VSLRSPSAINVWRGLRFGRVVAESRQRVGRLLALSTAARLFGSLRVCTALRNEAVQPNLGSSQSVGQQPRGSAKNDEENEGWSAGLGALSFENAV